ncbi:hypothetical protein BKA70DRAFT_847217 [Coprinopsis sp. MPI-PUGE-AT-0042]|nr:hypothetical protein BKA70DRAFT_847217 [Coprinopsis sp. MPI-PUGE-AT-0042]
MSAESGIPSDSLPATEETVISPLQQYAAYPFDLDESYQQGLASLLAGGAVPENATPEMRDEILRRTRVFYFNKQTGFNLSMDEAREYEISLLSALSTAGTSVAEATTSTGESAVSASEEERVLTFAELKELIESGKVDQIPNNKVIPEKFSEEPPSQSTTAVRKKPWETAGATGEAP